MEIYKLNEMVRGWVAGNFDPSCLKTDAFEAACKIYKAGDQENPHYHKIATELTIIASGVVEFNDKRYEQGDIVLIQPNEVVGFKSITDSITFVIKVPCVKGDKYDSNPADLHSS
jgi:quercetin dioxygenase-like cupin family protein